MTIGLNRGQHVFHMCYHWCIFYHKNTMNSMNSLNFKQITNITDQQGTIWFHKRWVNHHAIIPYLNCAVLFNVDFNSLGAQHDGAADGTGNLCSSADQYIMASGPQSLTDGIFNHPFNFSSCSVNYFRNYLSANTA